MQKILISFLACSSLVGCSKAPTDHKYLDGNPQLATNGPFTPPAMNFWPPDIVPHPHPPQPSPPNPEGDLA